VASKCIIWQPGQPRQAHRVAPPTHVSAFAIAFQLAAWVNIFYKSPSKRVSGLCQPAEGSVMFKTIVALAQRGAEDQLPDTGLVATTVTVYKTAPEAAHDCKFQVMVLLIEQTSWSSQSPGQHQSFAFRQQCTWTPTHKRIQRGNKRRNKRHLCHSGQPPCMQSCSCKETEGQSKMGAAGNEHHLIHNPVSAGAKVHNKWGTTCYWLATWAPAVQEITKCMHAVCCCWVDKSKPSLGIVGHTQ
jgi:hypothetical protein